MTHAATYKAPLDDWMFVLTRLLRVQDRTDLRGFDELTEESLRDILGEAARFHEEVLLPLSVAGDHEGARLEDGHVRTPKGFSEAWDRYRAAGWPFLSAPARLGGGGMPSILTATLGELRIATSHSFMMYGAFCTTAATMIDALGEDWMREHIVPRLMSGDWTATMGMTEAHAGSDLRQLRTKAVQQPDGSWRVTGSKIFISGGDHDLTDNIAHIVLAKIPDADGTIRDELSAVSVFVVPKLRIDPATGELGGSNGVQATRVEHKMGIEGSATCAMSFEDAIGWRIHDPSRSGSAGSMAAMFFMMNRARVGTSLSGVGYAELSYQLARAYAAERLAGRAVGGPRRPDLPADPLIVHPDIKRLLMSSRSFAEGARALALRAALWESEADAGDERADDLVHLLQPVLKAYYTDKGFEAANNGLQVLGGHGYMRDYGLEQAVRNAKIGQIYEGANGIQARDLVRNRLTSRDGRAVASFFAAVDEGLGAYVDDAALADDAAKVREATELLREATEDVLGFAEQDGLGAAYDLLTAYGIVAVAWTWVDCVAAARATGDAALLARKTTLARYWLDRELPLVSALCERISHGGAIYDPGVEGWL